VAAYPPRSCRRASWAGGLEWPRQAFRHRRFGGRESLAALRLSSIRRGARPAGKRRKRRPPDQRDDWFRREHRKVPATTVAGAGGEEPGGTAPRATPAPRAVTTANAHPRSELRSGAMNKSRILVWDAPTRVFHWALPCLRRRIRHPDASGCAMSTSCSLHRVRPDRLPADLGVVGTRYARFTSFAFGPRAVVAYLKSLLTLRPQHFLGTPGRQHRDLRPAGARPADGTHRLRALQRARGQWLEDLHEGWRTPCSGRVRAHPAGVIVGACCTGRISPARWSRLTKMGDPTGAIRARGGSSQRWCCEHRALWTASSR